MTTRTSNEIRDELALNGRALSQAREDAALYERIQNAKAETARLIKAGDKLTAELNKALAAEAKAVVANFEAGNRNFDVARVTPDGERPSLSRDRFVISWERLRWDMRVNENTWQRESVAGFALLDEPVLDYLVLHKSNLLPADILALSPGNPFDAMCKYFAGKSRHSFR